MGKRKPKMNLPSVEETVTEPVESDVMYITITVPIKKLSESFHTGNRKNLSDVYLKQLSYKQIEALWSVVEALQTEELILDNGSSASNKSAALRYILEQVSNKYTY